MEVTPTPPNRGRPSSAWFVLGGVLMMAAAVVFVVGLFVTVRESTTTDAILPADGSPARVSSPAATRRTLYVVNGAPAPACTVTDSTGAVRDLESSWADTRVTTRGEQWIGVASFDSGSGELLVTCASADGGPVRIGDPLGRSFVIGLLVTILLPMLLGGAGLMVLLVTTIRYATRKSA